MHLYKFMFDRLLNFYSYSEEFAPLGKRVALFAAAVEVDASRQCWNDEKRAVALSELAQEAAIQNDGVGRCAAARPPLQSKFLSDLLAHRPFISRSGLHERVRPPETLLINQERHPVSRRDAIILLHIASWCHTTFLIPRFWSETLNPAVIDEVLSFQLSHPSNPSGRTPGVEHLIERRKTLKQFGEFLRSRDLLTSTHLIEARGRTRSLKPQRSLSDNELHKLLTYLEKKALSKEQGVAALIANRNHAMVLLLLDTAARSKAVSSIAVRDLRVASSSSAYIRVSDKGEKVREIKLSAVTVRALRRYQSLREKCFGKVGEGTAPLFVTNRGAPIDRKVFSELIKDICHHAGVSVVGPHGLRRTIGRKLARHGHSTLAISKALDHSLLQTTNLYLDPAGSDPRITDANLELLEVPLRGRTTHLKAATSARSVIELLGAARKRIKERPPRSATLRTRTREEWINGYKAEATSTIDGYLESLSSGQSGVSPLTRFFQSSMFVTDSSALLNTFAAARALTARARLSCEGLGDFGITFRALHHFLALEAHRPQAQQGRQLPALSSSEVMRVLQSVESPDHVCSPVVEDSRSPVGRWYGARTAKILDICLARFSAAGGVEFWRRLFEREVLEKSLQSSQAEEQLDDRTVRIRRVALNNFSQYLCRSERILDYPVHLVHPRRPCAGPRVIPTVTMDDLKKIVRQAERDSAAAPEGWRIARMGHELAIKLIIGVAARIGEIPKICLHDFESADGGETLQLRLQTKGGGEIRRPIPREILPTLQRYIKMSGYHDPTEPLFKNRSGMPITEARLLKILNDKAIAAGVECLAGRTKSVTTRVIRASLATLAAERGADVRQLAELLRHQNLTSCDHYVSRHSSTNRIAAVQGLLGMKPE